MNSLPLQFFTPGSSKIEFFYEAYFFFDIVATKNDHPIYVKHVLDRISPPPHVQRIIMSQKYGPNG